MADALFRLGSWVIGNGVDSSGPHRAARDLLLRRGPRLADGSNELVLPDESTVDAAKRIGTLLDSSVLPIQGPPGSGKTFTGARMICELVRQGRKVGITATSHKVIQNLLLQVIKAAKEAGLGGLNCVQKVNEKQDVAPPGITLTTDNAEALAALRGDAQVVAGTAWLWSREEYFEAVDVLFVDEAGQMSLANVLAVSQGAKNLVLLGDPQQLEHPLKGSHPDGAAVSALEHILGVAKTISSDMGLFLEKTWRLHPKLCDFTSEVFYEGRLHPRGGLEKQRIEGHPWLGGSGLWFVPVPHEGNRNASAEEVECIAGLVASLLQAGVNWIDDKGLSRPLQLEDVLIVAPYNAQVSDLWKRIPNARVGHGGQVSGPGGASSHLLFNDVLARGCAARYGISLQLESAQCRNVARSGFSHCRRQPSSSGARVPQSTANAVGERALPLRRNRSSCGDAINTQVQPYLAVALRKGKNTGAQCKRLCEKVAAFT